MKAPDLKLKDVVQAANNFLQKYHPSLNLPIPIEKIVEIQMGIAVVVVPGIRKLLGIDSFISSDFSQITIDEYYYKTYEERTRFSIAHETGHYVLHHDWYKKYGPKNIEDYLTFHDRIDPKIYKYTEIQAQTFAGLVLVPHKLLKHRFLASLSALGLKKPDPIELLAPAVNDLATEFAVSSEVIVRRLAKEGLIKWNY